MATADDIISTWEERRESGNFATPEELCRDFPELLDEVRWQVRALMFVESQFGDVQGVSERGEADCGQSRLDVKRIVMVPSEYRIEGWHASGGLGDVFVAVDPVLRRRVAIKFPRAGRLSPEQLGRFEREARITARLDHPGIVPVHLLKTGFDCAPCYVMRFVEGPTFQERINLFFENATSRRPRDDFESPEWRTLLQHFVSLCNIVAFAHDQGVVHRDIKPGNVVLGPFGETLLLDWGLAKLADDPEPETPREGRVNPEDGTLGLTQSGQILGTPAFASPEQLEGDLAGIDFRTDVYSLGSTMFFLLTGKYVCEEKRLGEWLECLKSGKPISARARRPGVPRKLDAICQRAMATAPGDRYPSVTELRNDLESYLSGGPVSVVRDTLAARLTRSARRNPGWFATVALGILVIAAGAAVSAGLLGRKSQQLSRANQQLESAITDSLIANRQTLEALRSMVDDVVIRDLSGLEYPDQAEQDFLSRVLRQYTALAELNGDHLESRAIRAEGLLQIGRIRLRLSDELSALEKLREAVAQFERLVQETQSPQAREQLATSKGELGIALLRLGKLDEARLETDQSISLAEQIPIDSGNTQEMTQVLGNLYRIAGTIRIAQRDWSGSQKLLEMARDRFERSLDGNSAEANILSSLAAVYRLLGEVTRQQGDNENQLKYLEIALQTQRELVRNFPERPQYELGLILALNSISSHREFAGQITAALKESEEAVGVAERLAARFPTVRQYRESLAGIRYRRGLLYRTQDEPLAAERELEASVEVLSKLRMEAADLADYELAWQSAMLDLGRLKIDTARYEEGVQVLTRLISSAGAFASRFPELAQTNLALTIAAAEQTRLHRRMGLTSETENVLRAAITRFEELSKIDADGTPMYWSAKSRIYLSRTLRALRQVETARKEMDLAVTTVRDLTENSYAHLERLESVAMLHRELAIEFGGLKDLEKQRRHEQLELDLRKFIVQEMPENPFYRAQLAKAYLAQADAAKIDRHDQAALDGYAQAKSVIVETLAKYPQDVLLQKTMGDLCTRQGRLLYLLREFEKAEIEFQEAVRLNPSIENRASRANNMAWIKPEMVLGEVDQILAERIPDKAPLKSLLQACCVAAQKTGDSEMRQELEDRVVRMLQHMSDERYYPHPSTLKEFREQALYREMRQRPEFLALLEKLELQEQDLRGPAFIRQLPEWFRPFARWTMKQRWDRVLKGEFR